MSGFRRRNPFRFLFRFVYLVGLLAIAWGGGLVWFATSLPDRVVDDVSRTDAIVVLTGGSGRVATGLDLLSRDLGKKLFVSGVYRGVDVKTLLRVAERGPEGLEDRIGIGDAENTVANASETAAWMNENGYASLRLVTGSYHMPRSLQEFRRAMPKVGIIPHPVFPKNFKQAEWWAWPGTTELILTEYNKLILARIGHLSLSHWERLSGGAKSD